jgi:ribosomal protein S7
MFTRQGKKKTITNQVQHAMLHLKFKYQTIPLLILYELLETLKPVFLLRKYKIRRTQIVEYPYVAKNSRRYMRVLQWIRRELQHESRRMSSYSSFPERLYNKLSMAHDSPRSHSLIKTRDAHNAHSNMSQFNIRYN